MRREYFHFQKHKSQAPKTEKIENILEWITRKSAMGLIRALGLKETLGNYD